MALYLQEHPHARYFFGDCPEFAIALHRISNIPIAALVEFDEEISKYCLIHAFVMRSDGIVLDASGIESSVDQILEEFPNNGDVNLIWINEKELLELGYGDPLHPIAEETMILAKQVFLELEQEGLQMPINSTSISSFKPTL